MINWLIKNGNVCISDRTVFAHNSNCMWGFFLRLFKAIITEVTSVSKLKITDQNMTKCFFFNCNMSIILNPQNIELSHHSFFFKQRGHCASGAVNSRHKRIFYSQLESRESQSYYIVLL